MKNIRDSVLQRIRESRVTPIPRWRILSGRGALFGLFGLILSLAAVASALVFFQSEETGWYWRPRFPLPFFWLAVGAVAWLLSATVFRKLPRGYRWSRAVVLLAGILFVLGFGRMLHHMGASAHVDGFLQRHAGFYSGMCQHARAGWMNPAEGRLRGEVILGSANPDSPSRELTVRDSNGEIWRVGIQNAVFKAPRERYMNSKELRFVGKQLKHAGAEKLFRADQLLPMPAGGRWNHGRRN